MPSSHSVKALFLQAAENAGKEALPNLLPQRAHRDHLQGVGAGGYDYEHTTLLFRSGWQAGSRPFGICERASAPVLVVAPSKAVLHLAFRTW